MRHADDKSDDDPAAHNDDHEKPTNDRGIVKPEYYINDEAFTTDITALPGIGKKTAETLADENDVETVADMILAQLGDGEGVFSSIAVYDELTDALRDYEDYSRYDAYPVTGENYDGPHEVEDWWYYDEVAPIHATAGDRIRLRVADEQWTGEVRDVALEPACRVVLTIDADDGEIYNVVYDDGEWTRMTPVERRKDETVDVEIIDDRGAPADDDEAPHASQPDTNSPGTMTDTDPATEDETAHDRDDDENTDLEAIREWVEEYRAAVPYDPIDDEDDPETEEDRVRAAAEAAREAIREGADSMDAARRVADEYDLSLSIRENTPVADEKTRYVATLTADRMDVRVWTPRRRQPARVEVRGLGEVLNEWEVGYPDPDPDRDRPYPDPIVVGCEDTDRGLEVELRYQGQTTTVGVRFAHHGGRWVVDYAPECAPAEILDAAVEHAREEMIAGDLITPPSYAQE